MTRFFLTFFKAVGYHALELLFSIVLLSLLGFVFVPSWSETQKNSSGEACRNEMQTIAKEIETAFAKDEYNWDGVLSQKRSQQFLETIKEHSENKKMKNINTDTYFVDLKKTSMLLLCRAHEKNKPVEISIPKKYHTNHESADISTKPTGAIIVSGVRTYVRGTSLDKEQPEKMVFSKEDDLKRLFPDISVKIKYLDGETKELSKDEYVLSCDKIDMSKTGKNTIRVIYEGENNINTDIFGSFSFDVMAPSNAPALKVDFGGDKRFVLSAWGWSDYVKDTTSENNTTGASIVFYKGDYLYYPDGFFVDLFKNNTNPTISAMDIDDKSKPAYYIKIKKTEIAKSENEENPKEGMLWLGENDEIFIWQEKASKEADAGWLRVYCEVEKQ